MDNIAAESSNRSLVNRAGSSLQPLVRDVVQSSTKTAEEYSNGEKNLLVLTVLLKCLLDHTYSGDVRELAILGAIGHLEKVLDGNEVEKIARDFIKKARLPNIMDSMF